MTVAKIRLPVQIELAVLGRIFEERSNLLMLVTSQSAANTADAELELSMAGSISQESLDILIDPLNREWLEQLIFGGNGKAMAMVTIALAKLGAHILEGEQGSPLPVDSSFVGTKDEDVLRLFGS